MQIEKIRDINGDQRNQRPGRTAVIADQPAEHEEDENTHIEDDKSGNITEHLAGRVVKNSCKSKHEPIRFETSGTGLASKICAGTGTGRDRVKIIRSKQILRCHP